MVPSRIGGNFRGRRAEGRDRTTTRLSVSERYFRFCRAGRTIDGHDGAGESVNCSVRVAFFLSVALGFAGCGSGNRIQTGLTAHFGEACSLGATDGGDPYTVFVNPSAKECASGVCVLPSQEKSANGTGPLCTAGCSVDADCTAGETRLPGHRATDDPRCATGFACRTLVPKLESNPLACVPVCVCKDFLASATPRTPDGCPPPVGK